VKNTEALVSLVDAAVESKNVEEVVTRLRVGLCELINSGEIQLPQRVLECNADHYARRLLHRDDERKYSIVAMTWGPKQGTPLHDHGGTWCVEGVFRGSIEVQQYELLEQQGGQYRFDKRGSFQAGIGSAGCLIPPHEYHLIRNAGSVPAVSVHIYGGEMDRCSVFEPASQGWFVRHEKALGLDI
jgi:predicted metal-dependent enzyme (double-stranded beta helix superfamily)